MASQIGIGCVTTVVTLTHPICDVTILIVLVGVPLPPQFCQTPVLKSPDRAPLEFRQSAAKLLPEFR